MSDANTGAAYVVASSTFARFDISKWLSQNVVLVTMQGTPADDDDVDRFCGDFLAVLCTTAGLDVRASDEEVARTSLQMKAAGVPRKVGMVLHVSMDPASVTFVDRIMKWIESEHTQKRTLAFLQGTAVIVQNRAMREICNFILSNARGTAPRRAFEDEEAAVRWLKDLESGGHTSAVAT